MCKNKTIFLKNGVLENKEMSDYDIAVYVSLRNLYAGYGEEVLIDVDTILYDLYGDDFTKVGRKVKENFRKAIEHLGELVIIEIVRDLLRGRYIINMNNLYFEANAQNPFTTVRKEEVRKMFTLQTEENVDNLKLLRYFIMLMRTVNGKDGVGYMSLDHLAKLTNISKKSVITYNKILEDNEIIYIYHHDMIYSTGNDTISSLPNHYGKYTDKNKIEAQALGYEDDKKKEITDIKRKKKKVKENQDKKQQETRYGIAIGTKKESTKVETGSYVYDDDDVEFWGGIELWVKAQSI